MGTLIQRFNMASWFVRSQALTVWRRRTTPIRGTRGVLSPADLSRPLNQRSHLI